TRHSRNRRKNHRPKNRRPLRRRIPPPPSVGPHRFHDHGQFWAHSTANWPRSWWSLPRQPARARSGAGSDPQLLRGGGVRGAVRPGARRGDARRGGLRARPVSAGHSGGVRAGRRGGGRGAGADQGSRRQPGAVRPAAGHVPGGVPADRRRVHRVPHHAPGRPGGVLAARRRPRRRRRPRGGGILVRGAGTQVRSAVSSPARRDRDGRDLSLAPVFLADRRPEPVPAVFIDLTPEQRALRGELRGYFAGLMTQAERAELLTERHGAVYRDVVRRMGRDGWLGVGWAARYGGRGVGHVERPSYADEAARADVPLPAVTLQTVGPTLQEHGTPGQQDFFLPRILAGEVHFAIGYTEPEAGTDLASLRTRAVRDGEEYVVDGQKIFTTGAHAADYVWLACRTDPAAPKHKGISILTADPPDPGFPCPPTLTPH